LAGNAIQLASDGDGFWARLDSRVLVERMELRSAVAGILQGA